MTNRNPAKESAAADFTVSISEGQDQDKINPRPNEKTESEYLLEEFLSPPRLREIANQPNLNDVTHLQMVVDTTENSLGNFGHYLPNLKELDLTNSVISSVRDLGSSLSCLEVLWLTKCQIMDLDGLPTFYNLTELYLAYNHINNLSDLTMMENLRTLDLEANDIDDIDQILFIEMCKNLHNLCLQHNPICSAPKPLLPFDPDYNYRLAVIKILPQIKTLDDLPVDDQTQDFTNLDEDLQLLTENIKFGLVNEEDEERPGTASQKRPGTASRRPGTAMRPRSAMPSMLFGKSTFGVRPGTAAKFDRPPTAAEKAFFQLPVARPTTGSSVTSNDSAVDMDDFSKLTSGNIVCGNPLRALKKNKMKTDYKNSPMLKQLNGYSSAKSSSAAEKDEVFQALLEELKEWKEEFEGKGQSKISMSEEVNILTLGSGDATSEKKPLAPSNSKTSPEHQKKSSVNIRRRHYLPVADTPRSDASNSMELNHDESYEDADSGLASSRDTDTPGLLGDYHSQNRGPYRSSGSEIKLNELKEKNLKVAPHQLSIKPPLVPVKLKPSLENLSKDQSLKPKILNAARPAKATLEQMNRMKKATVIPPTPPHKIAAASARPKSSLPSMSYEKFSSAPKS